MNVYLLTHDVEYNCDFCIKKAVVVADSEEEARNMHPLESHGWYDVYASDFQCVDLSTDEDIIVVWTYYSHSSGKRESIHLDFWPSPQKVVATYVGPTELKRQVLCHDGE